MPGDESGQRESARQLLGDLPRRPLQDLCQLERHGTGEIAELDLRGRFEDDAWRVHAEDAPGGLRNGALELAFESGNHAAPPLQAAWALLGHMAARILARRKILPCLRTLRSCGRFSST